MDPLDIKKWQPRSTTQKLDDTFAPAFESWKADPTPEASSNLLKALDPVINEALRSYGGVQADSPQLRGAAKVMTLKVMPNYDPNAAKVRTYLLSQLQSLRRASVRQGDVVRVPEPAIVDQGRLRRAELELRDELSRDPSDMELADRAGLSLKRIGRVRQLTSPSYSEGSQTRMGADGEYTLTPVVVGQMSDKTQKLWQEMVYMDLDPVDQLIMEHTLGLHGKPVLQNREIAGRLRVTPGAVSQRKTRIQKKLDLSPLAGLEE